MPVAGPAARTTTHRRIAESCARHADRSAVVAPQGRWSYRELSAHVAAAAGTLRAAGVSSGDRVAHLFELEPDAIAAGLGALAAGAIWVPIDPDWPDERIGAILAECRPAALLCADALAARAARLAGGVPTTSASAAFARWPGAPADDVDAGEAALLLFTSGSTGVPKGVLIGHRGLLFNTDSHRRALDLDERDRVAMTVRPSYLAGVTSLFRGLLSGATVALRDNRRFGTVGLVPWLRDEGITVLQTTPTVFRQLASSAGDVPLPALRWLHLGGERASAGDVRRLAALPMPNARFLHNYGATETGTICQLALAPGEHFDGDELPVGAPIPGRRVRLVDAGGVEVAPGEVGEIVVESRELLALGYWRRPVETARAFAVPDPGDPELRAFRSGDLGRLDASGRLVHLGRADAQLNLGGQRVEAAEIESRLCGHPSVLEAALTAEEGHGAERRLVAHVVPRAGAGLDPGELRAFLLRSLPTHMIPVVWRSWPALPRTSTGKVDRLALAAPEPATRERSLVDAAPEDASLSELRRIWTRLLERPEVDLADDFFALGGTSLLAIELCLEVRSRLACEIEPSTLYAHPTLQALAKVIRAEETRKGSAALLFHPGGGRPAIACVPGNLTSPRVALGGLFEGLGADQPVVAFQDGPGLPADIGEVAEHYLEAWRERRGEAPDALVGICWGAAVAFEMARRLRERGEPVRLLALVEPPRLFPPGWLSVARTVVPAYLSRLARRGADYRSELAGLDRSARRLYLRQKRKMFRNSVALRLWAPLPTEGRVEVYLTEVSAASRHADRMIWTHLFAEPPRLRVVPGDHERLTGSDGATVDREVLVRLGRELRTRLDSLRVATR